jgi:small subunit ribosomal protein S16
MIKVRLARFGTKKKPYYHIVVTNSESPRDGRFIEQVGTYDPRKPMTEAKIDHERLQYWVGMGAQTSESLSKVIRELKKTAGSTSATAA